MKCKEIQELLMTDYMDGELDAGTLVQIKAHVETCAECRAIEGRLKDISASLKSAKAPTPPREIWQNIRNAVMSEQAYHPGILERVGEFFKAFLFSPRAVFARVAVAAVTILIVLFSHLWIQEVSMMNGEDIFAEYRLDDTFDTDGDFGTEVEEYFL